MKKFSGNTLMNLWQQGQGNKDNDSSMKSLDLLCDAAESSQDVITQGEIIFTGLESLLLSSTPTSKIRRNHRFMYFLSTLGQKLLLKEKGREGFYIGIFCELNLSTSWWDIKVVSLLKKLFISLRKKTLHLGFELKRKLLIKYKEYDPRSFNYLFQKAS